MIWQPVYPLFWLVPGVIAVALAAAWLSWRGSVLAPPGVRRALTALRVAAVLAVGFLLLNPGEWKPAGRPEQSYWAVVVDRSASMQVKEPSGRTRWEQAGGAADEFAKASGLPAEQVKRFGFAATAEPLADNTIADGTESAPVRAVEALLQRGESGDGSLAGIVLLTDGRRTTDAAAEAVALRARARQVPVHVLTVGEGGAPRDLSVQGAQRLILTRPGTAARQRVTLRNEGLGRIRPALVLTNAAGDVIQRQEVDLDSGASVPLVLEVPPDQAGSYRLSVPAWEGEEVLDNNSYDFTVQALTTRSRVFIAEGAPYWDSKFLAQLLREQSFMEVEAIYRLNAERYFRVGQGDSQPAETNAAVFPDTPEALGRFDLVVFGKGADYFMTPAREEALRRFVRDQGGAVLFARGRPYAGKFEGLGFLEPVEWGGPLTEEIRLTPAEAGAGAGLFGQVLPAVGDPVWATLPLLKDAERIERLKPFTRVLAYGTSNGADGAKIPLLMTRRYGRGAVALLNADGLWKWDFVPAARTASNMYESFWTQLIQWTAAYAEFLPGQDYAVRVLDPQPEAGRSLAVRILSRAPAGAAAKPMLRLVAPDGTAGDLIAASRVEAAEGEATGPEWTVAVTPDRPGAWRLQVPDPDKPDGPVAEAVVQIPGPVMESANLRADPESLRPLAEGSGGSLRPASAAAELGALARRPRPVNDAAAPLRFQPWWTQGWILSGTAGLLAAGWWLRRRHGLA